MSLYIAGFVILTLIVNAPLCAPLMTLLGLDRITQEQLQMRRHVSGQGQAGCGARRPGCQQTRTSGVACPAAAAWSRDVPELSRDSVTCDVTCLPPSLPPQVKELFRHYGGQSLSEIQLQQDEDDMLQVRGGGRGAEAGSGKRPTIALVLSA